MIWGIFTLPVEIFDTVSIVNIICYVLYKRKAAYLTGGDGNSSLSSVEQDFGRTGYPF